MEARRRRMAAGTRAQEVLVQTIAQQVATRDKYAEQGRASAGRSGFCRDISLLSKCSYRDPEQQHANNPACVFAVTWGLKRGRRSVSVLVFPEAA